jgi:type 1 glutamine amidotransferase
MKTLICPLVLAVVTACPALADEPLRIFIRAGVKTHGPGAHDHPRFLEDWRKLLNERGAKADGALEFPDAEQLDNADVIVFYAANAGNVNPEQRKLLEAFRARGGGLVFIHDAVCGDDAHWFKGVTGGAWEHGHSKWYEGPISLNFTDAEHPVTAGAVDFKMDDEIYWNLHMAPGAKILARTDSEKAPESPQLWSFEEGSSRTFTAIPGHWHSTFSLPHYKAILLRGIAWAGKREVDLLTTPDEVAAMAHPVESPAVKQDP